jgi:hypothetical protein
LSTITLASARSWWAIRAVRRLATLLAELWLGKAHHALAIRRSVVAAGGLGSKLCLRMKIDGRPPVILTTVEADVSPPP